MLLPAVIFLLLFTGIILVGVQLIQEGWQFGLLDGLAGTAIGFAALLIGIFGCVAIVVTFFSSL